MQVTKNALFTLALLAATPAMAVSPAKEITLDVMGTQVMLKEHEFKGKEGKGTLVEDARFELNGLSYLFKARTPFTYIKEDKFLPKMGTLAAPLAWTHENFSFEMPEGAIVTFLIEKEKGAYRCSLSEIALKKDVELTLGETKLKMQDRVWFTRAGIIDRFRLAEAAKFEFKGGWVNAPWGALVFINLHTNNQGWIAKVQMENAELAELTYGSEKIKAKEVMFGLQPDHKSLYLNFALIGVDTEITVGGMKKKVVAGGKITVNPKEQLEYAAPRGLANADASGEVIRKSKK
jgi:hypothetical protein